VRTHPTEWGRELRKSSNGQRTVFPEPPLTPTELELMKLNFKIHKWGGQLEPPDIEADRLSDLISKAQAERAAAGGPWTSDLDELERIARKNSQHPQPTISLQEGCLTVDRSRTETMMGQLANLCLSLSDAPPQTVIEIKQSSDEILIRIRLKP
jgi:hypothetical protein